MKTSYDMTGKNVLITGATAGIGRAAAEELARQGAHILGVSRNPDKCNKTADEIRAATGNPHIQFMSANLSSMTHVAQTARAASAHFPKIDVLVNNVGAIFHRYMETEDGFERTFALNHLSPFLLTNLLLDNILAGAPARIINVASSAQFTGKMHFDNLNLTGSFRTFKVYGQSKLANMLFTYELNRRIAGSGVTVNAMHPGLVRTNIATNNFPLFRQAQSLALIWARTPERGARTIIYLASSPDVEGVTGKYFVDEKAVASATASYNEQDAARLWEVSEQMLQPFLAEKEPAAE